MVSWWLLIIAFIVGGWFGFSMAALFTAAKDNKED